MLKLSRILPVFFAVSFGFVATGCDKKETEKPEDKKAAEDKKVDDGKTEEKGDGGW